MRRLLATIVFFVLHLYYVVYNFKLIDNLFQLGLILVFTFISYFIIVLIELFFKHKRTENRGQSFLRFFLSQITPPKKNVNAETNRILMRYTIGVFLIALSSSSLIGGFMMLLSSDRHIASEVLFENFIIHLTPALISFVYLIVIPVLYNTLAARIVAHQKLDFAQIYSFLPIKFFYVFCYILAFVGFVFAWFFVFILVLMESIFVFRDRKGVRADGSLPKKIYH